MCFSTTNISAITQPITLQPGPFERLIWNHLVIFLTLNNILTQITIKANGKQGNLKFGEHLEWCS